MVERRQIASEQSQRQTAKNFYVSLRAIHDAYLSGWKRGIALPENGLRRDDFQRAEAAHNLLDKILEDVSHEYPDVDRDTLRRLHRNEPLARRIVFGLFRSREDLDDTIADFGLGREELRVLNNGLEEWRNSNVETPEQFFERVDFLKRVRAQARP
ncbi:hypothetical protein HYT33_00650 [Candidatus Roizmanbacteria bacterium]|nr:hypothetical protein [Candidatus Roizmanbacteria bacterium]